MTPLPILHIYSWAQLPEYPWALRSLWEARGPGAPLPPILRLCICMTFYDILHMFKFAAVRISKKYCPLNVVGLARLFCILFAIPKMFSIVYHAGPGTNMSHVPVL